MDSVVLSPQSSLETPPSSVASRRNKYFVPLSSHGMPKTPYSPDGSVRPHRFSTIESSPYSPTSPPVVTPMSPPMSAKSFGTFIDSAPSTPAYSPRAGSGWDNNSSTIMLLSPASTAPSSPPEPQWEMVAPPSAQKKTKNMPSVGWNPVKPILEEDPSQKENHAPAEKDGEKTGDSDAERKTKEEQSSHGAPLGRIATRVKSILRRRATVSEKKSASTSSGESRAERRRRKYHDLDYMEDQHWTVA